MPIMNFVTVDFSWNQHSEPVKSKHAENSVSIERSLRWGRKCVLKMLAAENVLSVK